MPVKKEPLLFLSYGREDQMAVEKIYNLLFDAGFEPWMDIKNLLPGEVWPESIRTTIKRCDFFLLCLSSRSFNKRGYLQKEVKDALDIWKEKINSDIFLIPIKLDKGFDLPEEIAKFQYVSLSQNNWFGLLRQAICAGMERRIPRVSEAEPAPTEPLEIDFDFSKTRPNLELSLSLFQQHLFNDEVLPRIEHRLSQVFSWPEKRAHAVSFIINELVSNAFEHGCCGGGELEVSFSLRFEVNNTRLVIRVKSPGPGFNLSEVLKKGDPEDIEGERGRGLAFVKRIADQMIASSDGRIIQVIILRKSTKKEGLKLQISHVDIGFEVITIIEFLNTERIDSHNSSLLKEFLLKCVEDGHRLLVLDLEKIRFIDSSGLGALLSGYKNASARKGKIVLANPKPQVQSMLELTKLDRIFVDFPDTNAAIKFLEEWFLEFPNAEPRGPIRLNQPPHADPKVPSTALRETITDQPTKVVTTYPLYMQEPDEMVAAVQSYCATRAKMLQGHLNLLWKTLKGLVKAG